MRITKDLKPGMSFAMNDKRYTYLEKDEFEIEELPDRVEPPNRHMAKSFCRSPVLLSLEIQNVAIIASILRLACFLLLVDGAENINARRLTAANLRYVMILQKNTVMKM
jgi:hypothetical protein